MGQSKAALPCCSRWVLHIMVRTCVVVQPYALPLGSTCRCWALRVVVGLYVSLLGSTHRRWALCIAFGLDASSWGPLPRRLPLRLVVHRCWALCVVVMVGQPGWALAGHRGGCYTGGRHCVGFNGISWGQGKSDERKRATTFVVAHSR